MSKRGLQYLKGGNIKCMHAAGGSAINTFTKKVLLTWLSLFETMGL